MTEEINRVVIDHCSSYLFAPTEYTRTLLNKEGVLENRIFVTGNTIVDMVNEYSNFIQRDDMSGMLGLKPKRYILVTAHRRENIEDKDRFNSIIEAIKYVSKDYDLPIVYSMHPHSEIMIKKFGINTDGIMIIQPPNFANFLQLEKFARLILTDSGGVQEESCVLGVPCVTLRDNTERPETIEVGGSVLAGADKQKILDCVNIMMEKRNHWINPFGDGKSGERIVGIINEKLG
jgi:UDP-N-acetylglucosamine 2-epimerase (non-hydrolysing)